MWVLQEYLCIYVFWFPLSALIRTEKSNVLVLWNANMLPFLEYRIRFKSVENVWRLYSDTSLVYSCIQDGIISIYSARKVLCNKGLIFILALILIDLNCLNAVWNYNLEHQITLMLNYSEIFNFIYVIQVFIAFWKCICFFLWENKTNSLMQRQGKMHLKQNKYIINIQTRTKSISYTV